MNDVSVRPTPEVSSAGGAQSGDRHHPRHPVSSNVAVGKSSRNGVVHWKIIAKCRF